MKVIVTCLFMSVLLNSLLLFLLYRTRKIIGNYRYLLMIYSVFLVSFNVLDFIMMPMVHIHKTGFIYFATSSMRHRPIGLVLAVLHSVSQGVCIVLLSINFLFRYKTLNNTFFSKYWFLWPIASAFLLALWGYAAVFLALANDFFDFFFRDSVLEKTNTDILDAGYYAVVYWKGNNIYWPSFFALVFVGFCETVTCTIIGICGFSLYRSIRDASQLTSGTIAKVNKDLFRTLVLQTVAPVFMIYIPCAILILFPFFELNFGIIEDVQPVLMSVFPIIDTLIMLVCFRAFRKTLKEIFIKNTASVSNSIALRQIGPSANP